MNITCIFDELAFIVRFPKGREDVVAGAVVVLANKLLQVLRCLFTVIFWSMNKTDNELTQQLTVGHLWEEVVGDMIMGDCVMNK